MCRLIQFKYNPIRSKTKTPTQHGMKAYYKNTVKIFFKENLRIGKIIFIY